MTGKINGAVLGDVFEGSALRFSIERVLAFSGGLFGEANWPARNLHTDRGKAREAGLPDIIVSGTQFEGHLVDLLIDLFGEAAWFGNGVLEVRIPKSVMLDDTVRARVTVTAVRHEAGGIMHDLDIVSLNQRDELVLKGTASCRIKGPSLSDPD